MDLEQKILTYLEANECILDTWTFATSQGLDHQTVIGVIKSLSADQYVLDEPLSTSFWTVTGEGDIFAVSGTPEFQVRLFRFVKCELDPYLICSFMRT